jgi:hypothetical protein
VFDPAFSLGEFLLESFYLLLALSLALAEMQKVIDALDRYMT